MMIRAFLSAWVVCAASISVAAEIPAGTAAVGNEISQFRFMGGADNGRRADVDAPAPGPGRAARVEVLRDGIRSWDVQLATRTAIAVEKDDVLLLSFWMRAVSSKQETGEAIAVAIFEQAGPPHSKSLEFRASAGKEWKQFQLPFTSLANYPAGGASVGFHCGTGMQTFEIGGIQLTHYAKKVKLDALPRTRTWYAGHEPDAPWRKEAAQRIEKLRKGDLTIEVTDAAGKAVANAAIEVKMTRHAFGFGSAVAADAILGERPDSERYRREIVRLFNRVVMENDLKWPQWEGNQARAVKGVDWLRQQGIAVRGHNLIWPSWRYAPRDLQNLKNNPEALRKRIDDHILDETAAMKGKLVEWDVINEPFSNKDVMAVLGDEEMVRWFKLARQGDAGAVLFLNDYPLLAGRPDAHMAHFEKTIQFLIDKGAPIGGIGVQGHYGSNLPGIQQALASLDRLAKFKLPIAITELDVDMNDEAMQADFLRDITTACFSHEAVDSIIMWGFWEGRHWKPRAALYRRDWSIKPNGQAWEDLVLKQWWTTGTLKSDAGGKASMRGFLGEYEIRVNGKMQKARLEKGGSVVRVKA